MKIHFKKATGGILIPASPIEESRMQRFRSGEIYPVEIKLSRNSGFHKKVFAFMTWAFEYWKSESTQAEFMCEIAQFDFFRKELTILAGYYDYVVSVNGQAQVNVRSLAFDSMTQEEFEQFNTAMTNAAIKHVFNNTTDENILNKLYSFF